MLTKLERYIDQLGELNNKLIVLAGPRNSGKTKLLHELGKKLSVEPLNVNLELGRRLSATPHAGRGFSRQFRISEARSNHRNECCSGSKSAKCRGRWRRNHGLKSRILSAGPCEDQRLVIEQLTRQFPSPTKIRK
ncbi:MAG: BREX-3 system P-loop-containing protein BrxF [Rugosibacter sp.]|jgi:hypothetical protein|nr:BREX-3 system P-loop-containing protein BrxF [Rugosibacter sp.]